jgi:glycosyltransferase involved in cell wall biosynthesis
MLFIPAYNCEVQLPRVIAKINDRVQSHIHEVVVIENRSTDGTLAAAKKAIATLSVKATVLQNNENYSLGGSIKNAFLYAIDHGHDRVIVLHGDDQADIRDLLTVLDDESMTEKDLVIGARFHPGSEVHGYSTVRKLGNRVLNGAFALVARRQVYDLIAGLNIFRVSFFSDRVFLNFPNNLTFDAHLLLYAFNRKAAIAYVPVTWREDDQVSNAKVVKQAIIILRLLGRYILHGRSVFLVNRSGRPAGFSYESTVVAEVNA